MFSDINMVRWLLSVLVLVLLLGGAALIAPYIGKRRNAFNTKGKKKKLSIIETLHIDAKRKVVLFTVGNTEHAVLIGPHEDVHISAEPVDISETIEDEELSIGFLKEIHSEKDDKVAKKSNKKEKKVK